MDLKPALSLIKQFEGYRSTAYQDPVGVWTIGYGTTVYPDGSRVKAGDKCNEVQASEYMSTDILNTRLPAIQKLVKVSCSDNELCALISFCYNVGVRALAGSTLLKKLNAHIGDTEVAQEFLKWNHAGGRVLPGLTRRRKAEMALFLTRDARQVLT